MQIRLHPSPGLPITGKIPLETNSGPEDWERGAYQSAWRIDSFIGYPKMTESSCHFLRHCWLQIENSDSADEIKSWRRSADGWKLVHSRDLWWIPGSWYFLRNALKWSGRVLHFAPVLGSLMAFGGQLLLVFVIWLSFRRCCSRCTFYIYQDNL
jgi:hypothetical protein